ncbi:BatD family protein [Rhabdobacter roseus]|uniref:Protein BatD n=1 Tax=Rhabdobacter roseus TaxID=1655419 RepID=A0A840TS16_9BACT|nr:BatD family protein [Rhabdobacter roseus]MBB5286731.1 hypothetical protein [Rhabdobacter roseus]
MKLYVYLNIILCFSAYAQQPISDVSVETGDTQLRLDQPFIVSVIVRNSDERPVVSFPEIKGLEKRSASATTTSSTVGGKVVLTQTISQQYFASREGTYEIEGGLVSVNGVKFKLEDLNLTFTAATEANDLAQDSEESEGASVESIEGDIFLALSTTKSSVYIREGFAIRLSLYVAEDAQVDMSFYRLDAQLQAILKKIRPANCWEENVGIEEIIERPVTIQGKKFTEYRMYQAVFFPLTLQAIAFPAISLEMQVLEPGTEGGTRKQSLRKFSAKPAKVLVKELPPHPQKDQVAVGEYRLEERLSEPQVASGESFRYLFKLVGTGNIPALTASEVPASQYFDFYAPDIGQVIRRSYDRVSGEKTFDYFVVAKQKGRFPLGRFFQWIYFDPRRARYDTLRSDKTIEVVGESKIAEGIGQGTLTSIYDNIEQLDTSESTPNYQEITRNLINAVVLVMLVGMVWIFRK